MAKATINIPQFQGTQQVNRAIEPTANYVLGFDSDKKLTAISGDSIVEAGEVTLTGTQELTNKTVTAQIVKTGLTASGSATNDFSGSTGNFKTSSGANTLSGDVSIMAGKNITYLAGDGAFDASPGTGIFKTTTGAHTLGGAVSTAFDVTFTAIGKGPIHKQGANGRVGTFVLNGTTPVAVSNSSVATTDAIVISLNTVGGTVGVQPHVATITGASGFTVVGTAGDTSTYNYTLLKNAA